MNRQEALQREHETRVGKARLDTALPVVGGGRRSGSRWQLCVVVLILLAAGVAGWLLWGGR